MNWKPVTLIDEAPEKTLEFFLTPHERDVAMLARLEIMARRRHENESTQLGLEVEEISMDEWELAGGHV